MLQSDRFRDHPVIRHGFTGRLQTAQPAEGNVGFGAPRDKVAAALERERWAAAIGIDAATIYSVHQVHGNQVVAIEQPRGDSPVSLGQADAIMTGTPGVAVMTLHADCLPVILIDPDHPAVCTVHAGWRGTVADAVGNAARAMTAAYGSDPARISAIFGPGMKACCYEVGDEVVDSWKDVAGNDAEVALARGPRRWHIDLGIANRLLLLRSGLLAENIEDPELCTSCNQDRWFSHRAQGPETGRFGAMAGIAPF